MRFQTARSRLRCGPGIGPIVALTVLAEAGDLRRFSHYRKFLNYCGLALATSQSGKRSTVPQLSSAVTHGCVCVLDSRESSDHAAP